MMIPTSSRSDSSEAPDEELTVRLYCGACGNATTTVVPTGEEIPTRLAIPRELLPALQRDLERLKCVVCGGPTRVEIVRA